MKKTIQANGKAKVTFDLPAAVEADSVSVCGDFNDWEPGAHVMTRRKDGRLSVTITLAPGEYRFRYLLDGDRWENDWEADDYVANDHGGDDSVVIV